MLQEEVTSLDPIRIVGLQLPNDFRIEAQPIGQEGKPVLSHGIRLFNSWLGLILLFLRAFSDHPGEMPQCKEMELPVAEFDLIRHTPFTHIEHRFGVLHDDCTRSLVCAGELLLHHVMQ